jgi:hypothetical protein
MTGSSPFADATRAGSRADSVPSIHVDRDCALGMLQDSLPAVSAVVDSRSSVDAGSFGLVYLVSPALMLRESAAGL